MNPLRKARARPDLVRKVLSKAGQDGLLATARIVKNLVSAPLPLGYSCAGYVHTVGAQVSDIQPGQRVACAGLGYANHAELVYVPRNLLVPIPDAVSFEDSAFVTVGAIALQGVRQAQLTTGETVLVIGMGLVGQIAAQICSASGCRVFCTDPDNAKIELALMLGAEGGSSARGEDLAGAVNRFTRSRGVDAIIICAATKSSEPMQVAAALARDRARIVAVGDVGHDIPRRAFYEKELELRQSRSYGPGRYDPIYEEHGVDYPLGYVRWTENRNMEAFLDLVSTGRVTVSGLITHRFDVERALEAYALVTGERKEQFIGIMLQYDSDREQPTEVQLAPVARSKGSRGNLSFGVIGAGQFAQGILLPSLKAVGSVRFQSVCTGSGLTSVNVARKYGAAKCTSDYRAVIADPDVDVVIVATRHDSHAQIVIEALEADKHCFVEKPLALTSDELQAIADAERRSDAVLLTGYNRRFSPMAVVLREAFEDVPLNIHYRVNAGAVAGNVWQQDTVVGGGRIVGEICHFVDTLQYLSGALVSSVTAQAVGQHEIGAADPDNLAVLLSFGNGSVATILYTSTGDPGFPKERIEMFGGGCVGIIESWRSVRLTGDQRYRKRAWLQAQKGFREEMAAFMAGVRAGLSPIPVVEQLHTALVTFAIRESLRVGQTVEVNPPHGRRE